ncbi:MAG: AAA family ATPase [Bacteroidales bacterium]|nr:AAA family ATPase [Bacteroidales bacterium]
MDLLIEIHRQRLKWTDTTFVRSLVNRIDWNSRLIGIKGSRGVGKTTLMLQYIKQNYGNSTDVLYVSLDNIWFTNHKMSDLVDDFVKRGGKYLFLDEVHKYPSWAQEIKNVYDNYPQLSIVFTGSSLLEILNARADLSRRADIYHLPGLSFREYMEMFHGIRLPTYSFPDILERHSDISDEVLSLFRPLQYFDDYLREGYYPFYGSITNRVGNQI